MNLSYPDVDNHLKYTFNSALTLGSIRILFLKTVKKVEKAILGLRLIIKNPVLRYFTLVNAIRIILQKTRVKMSSRPSLQKF